MMSVTAVPSEDVMIEQLSAHLGLGSLLQAINDGVGRYDVLDHWTQGEFHHDLLLRVHGSSDRLPGNILVVATNCNGGVKELLCFDDVPTPSALWHERCPDNPEFSGSLPRLLDRRRTIHWFDPCALLTADADSELKPEFRQRQPGGGWMPKSCGQG